MHRRIPSASFLAAVLALAPAVAWADGGAPWGTVSVEARRDTGGWRIAVEGPTGLPAGVVVRFEVLRLASPGGEPFGGPETTLLGTIDARGRLDIPSTDRALPAGSYRVRLRVLRLDQSRSVERTIPPACYGDPMEFICRAGTLAERLQEVSQDLTHATRGLAVVVQAYRAFTEAETLNRVHLDRGAPWPHEDLEDKRAWEGMRTRHHHALESLLVSWRAGVDRPPALWRTAEASVQATVNLSNRELETWSVLVGEPLHGFIPFTENPGPVASVLEGAHREAMLACLPLIEECIPGLDADVPVPASPDPATLVAMRLLAEVWERYCALLEPDEIPLAGPSERVAAAARAFCDGSESGGEALRNAIREARLALEGSDASQR